AFTAAAASALIIVTIAASFELVVLVRPKLARSTARIVAAAPAIALLSTPALLKQACTAEVYLLNGLLMAALFLIFLRWRRSGDQRLAVLLAFLAALSLGNH